MRSAIALLFAGALATGWVATDSVLREPLGAPGEMIAVEAEDGFLLAATLRRGEAGAPAVLLLHQCDGDRSMYDGLGGELARRGFPSLAIDLRGLGGSAGPELDLAAEASREAWARAEAGFPLDIAAALGRLVEVADGGRLAVVGASCGGREAVRAAADRDDVSALVLLSARLEEAELELLAQRPDLPLLLITAMEDHAAYQSALVADADSRSPSTELRLYPGKHHGAALLRLDRQLEGDVADWLAKVLRPPS